MATFQEMERRLEAVERNLQLANDTIANINRKIVGEGEIILSGNRIKIDVSGALSDYQLKPKQ